MKITLVAGARPNFMKIAPILRAIEGAAIRGEDIQYRLVHTGQHYDKAMSGSFFEQLGIPEPNVNLECGGGSHAEQTAAIMVAFEKELMAHPCDWVVVVGDVTSTMACSISAKKLHIKVAHVEGGIRSGDITMPEEINRLVTDAITNWFFTTSEVANSHLRRAGVLDDRIFFVGNTMIDTLLANLDRLRPPSFVAERGLVPGEFLVMTLHRPGNVDDPVGLARLLEVIGQETTGLPVVFPVHPRTQKTLAQLPSVPSSLVVVEPQPYLEFNWLVKHALGVITDSGGITEETTVLGVPCLTLRDTTERPETVTLGTNELIGTDPTQLAPALRRLMSGQWKKGQIPPLWDGHAASRIVPHLERLLTSS